MLIIIILISLILIRTFYTHTARLRQYLLHYTDRLELFDVCCKYENPMNVEPSIKIAGQSILSDRYTIPYHCRKMPQSTIAEILNDLRIPTVEFLEFTAKHRTEHGDIIFGINGESYKIYTDDGMGTLHCAELVNGRMSYREYHRVSKRFAHKYSDIISLDNIDMVLLKSGTGAEENYHIRLKSMVKTSELLPISDKFLDHYVSWVSVTPSSLTLYTRPWYWYSPMLLFTQW